MQQEIQFLLSIKVRKKFFLSSSTLLVSCFKHEIRSHIPSICCFLQDCFFEEKLSHVFKRNQQ